jgi:hypothetical protein
VDRRELKKTLVRSLKLLLNEERGPS